VVGGGWWCGSGVGGGGGGVDARHAVRARMVNRVAVAPRGAAAQPQRGGTEQAVEGHGARGARPQARRRVFSIASSSQRSPPNENPRG